MSNGNNGHNETIPNGLAISTEIVNHTKVINIEVDESCGIGQETITQIMSEICSQVGKRRLEKRPTMAIVDLTSFGTDIVRTMPVGINSNEYPEFFESLEFLKRKDHTTTFIVDPSKSRAMFTWITNAYAQSGGGNGLRFYIVHSKEEALAKITPLEEEEF